MRRALEGPAQILQTASLESPLISVVLPTFNRAALLPGSIESVLSQTEGRLELIIVDDGSTDSTPDVIGRYLKRDQRITYIRQPNLRLPTALNNGFRVARGEFFTWTSDDNRYFPEAFSVMSRHLLDHRQASLVFAEMLRRRPEGLIHLPVSDPKDFWRSNTFGAAFLYRREVAKRVGEYDAELGLVEDYDFFLRMSYCATVHHLPYVVYEYLDHGDSLTNLRSEHLVHALERLLAKHIGLGQAKRWQLSRLAATISGIHRRTGRYGDAIRLAGVAWRLWPTNIRPYRTAILASIQYLLRAAGLGAY